MVVDKAWLVAVREFFQEDNRQVGQGFIGLQSTPNDPEILKLVEIYRTIPKLEYDSQVGNLHSLNGANFFMSRELFNRVGGFDERLGPGASGTSEDVDLARRLIRSGVSISYAPKAVVYHRIDRDRLTEAYFKQSHRRQGASRFLIRKQGGAEILFNLLRVVTQYGYYTLLGQERNRYRSKGRIYHYLGMIEAKQNDSKSAGTKDDLRTRSPSPHLSELLVLPSPSKLKSKLKDVLAGLIVRLILRVAVQHSQKDRNLVMARTPRKRLSSTS